MRKNRYVYREIAETLGISRQRVYQILEKWAVENSTLKPKKPHR
mgnify:FL=1